MQGSPLIASWLASEDLIRTTIFTHSDYGGYVKILVMTLRFCNVDDGGHLLCCENYLRGNRWKKVKMFLGS